MATKKVAPPTGVIADAVIVDSMLTIITGKLNLDQQLKLNTALVKHLREQQRKQRTIASMAFDPGDYVEFISRKTGRRVVLKVEKVTPAGLVYGTSTDFVKWKVSATLCKKTNAPVGKVAL